MYEIAIGQMKADGIDGRVAYGKMLGTSIICGLSRSIFVQPSCQDGQKPVSYLGFVGDGCAHWNYFNRIWNEILGWRRGMCRNDLETA